ncbi:pyridoxamine 5'-phosphate oxidase family protein [Saccharopolyspora pogona]|uniref:pyridoxamine 5'-phosphate oxidase family protein n=1 Tax=Saccharopolyspora pogona TaxID=333966 RepID=UPI0016844E46|nr:pyridoxamine 5'-phosphate oxidase family protein [Saccharopolyspora pogona]
MTTATSMLTAEDLEFLGRPLHGFLTMPGGPQPPQPRPVWFEATPAGERERSLSITGRTTVETDGAHDLASRLAARYWNLHGRADDLAAILAEDQVRVVLQPEAVHRFTF